MSTMEIANEVIVRVRKDAPARSWKGLLENQRFLNCVSVVGFFLIWDYLAAHKTLGNSLARPHEVVEQIIYMFNNRLAGLTLWGHMWASTQRVLIGWSIASLVAIPLGVFLALNDYVRAIIKPVFDLLKPMPPIAWISISILWLGIGETSKVFIIMIGTFVPCLLNAYNGLRLVDPELYDVIRVLGGRRRDEIFLISFPGSLPAIFAGLQISLSMAWMCVLAAELVSSRSGLGFLIITGMNISKPALILSGMVMIAVIAYLTSLGMSYLEKKLCPWKRDIAGF
ncbi:MAG: ABC transporter permease [Deltaproteobacteria bacterium]|nr:ABC transporter permease [Deltaproteobacteria bacterium]